MNSGDIVRGLEIIKRVENYIGNADTRTQHLVKCTVCENEMVMVTRNIKRRATTKGCKYCYKRKTSENSIQGFPISTIMGMQK
jgi:hypothetical protein